MGNNPALVLLDLMLPGKDCLTLCKEIRQLPEVPIIMVSTRIEEIDRLLGLEPGQMTTPVNHSVQDRGYSFWFKTECNDTPPVTVDKALFNRMDGL